MQVTIIDLIQPNVMITSPAGIDTSCFPSR